MCAHAAFGAEVAFGGKTQEAEGYHAGVGYLFNFYNLL